jgi:hypothetical protein
LTLLALPARLMLPARLTVLLTARALPLPKPTLGFFPPAALPWLLALLREPAFDCPWPAAAAPAPLVRAEGRLPLWSCWPAFGGSAEL